MLNSYTIIKKLIFDRRRFKILFRLLKKTLAVCLIGFGIGILLVIFLPFYGWLFIIGFAIVAVGLAWLCC